MSKHPAIKIHLCCLIWLVAALLIGCRDYGVEENNAQENVLSRFDAHGRAWLYLEIPLGTDILTRSSFDDGNENEYAVHNVMIVLFRGTGSEDELTVASTYIFTDWEEKGKAYQISKRLQINSSNIEKEDDIYLLAILNATPTIGIGTKFENVKTILSDITTTANSNNYFVMSNAPLAANNNGTGTVNTLVYLPPSFFFATEEEAAANPAAQIYVERAAAKVTVSTATTPPTTILGNPNITFTATDLNYTLDNYNENSTLVRQFNADWLPYRSAAGNPLRFVEAIALPFQPACYRTYWAQDQNYSDVPGTNSTPALTFKPHAQRTDITWKGMGTNSYCAENTFDAAYQQDNCTTSILVRLQLNGGNDFYTTSVTGSDIVYLAPHNSVSEEGTSAESSFSRQHRSPAISAKTIDEYLRTWLMQVNPDFRQWVNDYAAGEPKHVNICVVGDAETGLATVAKVTQTARATNSAGATAFTALNLETYFSNNITIHYYKEGYCYYRVPIRHFTDDETPWESVASMTSNTTGQAYQASGEYTADKRYLGRYGLVRNNWYTIDIRSITHVGSPIIPVLTTNADDMVEQLLNTTLNISPWTIHDTPL